MLSRILSLLIVFLIIIGGASILLPQTASALEIGTYGILPANSDPADSRTKGWFIYDLEPGKSAEDAAVVRNNTDSTVTFKIYAVDATLTSDGGFALEDELFTHQTIGQWIVLTKSIVQVDPGEQEIVPFTITIPNDVEVGDHAGGIIIEPISVEQKIDGTGVNIKIRVGARVYQTVPGEIRRTMEVVDFSYKLIRDSQQEQEEMFFGSVQDFLGFRRKANLVLELKNTGNVHLLPVGQFTIWNTFGTRIDAFEGDLGTIFRDKAIEFPVHWFRSGPFFGKYTVEASIDYGGDSPEVVRMSMWIVPWNFIYAIALLIVLVVLTRLFALLIVYKEKAKMPAHLVQTGETLESIAKDYHTQWKLIARANRIKAPFAIRPGQMLLVPHGTMTTLLVRRLFSSWLNVIIMSVIAMLIVGAVVYWIWKANTLPPGSEIPVQVVQEQIDPAQQDRIVRDNQRKIDLLVIKEALNNYYQDNQAYPIALERIRTNDQGAIIYQALVEGGYLERLLVDPYDPTYYYGYRSDETGQTYELTSVLENENDPDGTPVGKYFIYQLTP